MSRNLVITLVVLCAAVAALIILPKMRPRSDQQTTTVTSDTGATPTPAVNVTSGTTPQHLVTVPAVGTSQAKTTIVARATIPTTVITNEVPETEPDTKPLPVLEKEYTATTNRDTRLDLIMDIADAPGPESILALSRLFDTETDADLKVDLLDSLLGIEGFVEEKLKLLAKGAQKGLPGDVRQSAIDGLIDLDDQRVIPVLNGLLNDPDEEIRESAKDALEMLQSQPAVKLK